MKQIKLEIEQRKIQHSIHWVMEEINFLSIHNAPIEEFVRNSLGFILEDYKGFNKRRVKIHNCEMKM